MDDSDKKYAVIYSLNHKNLVASGVTNYMEVLDAYSNKEVNHLDLSEELINSNIIEPVMLVDITKNNRITEEQMEHIGGLSGKSAIRERREDFEYLKPLLDKPFWTAEQGMLISTEDSTEIVLNSGNKIFPTTDFIIENNKKAENANYTHSFNIKSLKEAFKEAREVLSSESNDSISQIFENSDRESRVVLVGAIMNDTLGLSNNKRKDIDSVIEMFNSFKGMDEYKDYINNFGLASTQNDDIKKAYLATRKIEKYSLESEEIKEKNKDYIENVIKKDITKLLDEMNGSIENKVISVIEGSDLKSIEPESPKKKRAKKTQLTLNV